MAYNITRLAQEDLTPSEAAALSDDELRADALQVLSMYGTDFGAQLEDEDPNA